jgi:hypothetical protein
MAVSNEILELGMWNLVQLYIANISYQYTEIY